MRTTTLKRIDNYSDKTIEGGTFLILMVAMVAAVYIYQMIDIALNGDQMVKDDAGIIFGGMPAGTGNYVDGGGQLKGAEMIRQTIQSVGSISILIGITYIARGAKIGGLYNVIGNILIMTNGFMTGLGFETVTRFLMFALYTNTFVKYDKKASAATGEISRAGIKEGTVAASILSVGLIVAGIVVGTDSADIIGMETPFPDAIQGTLNISAIYLLSKRKTEGQFAFVISNLFALVMFLIVGQPVMFFSTLAFGLVSVVAGFQGESQYAMRTNTNFMYVFKVQA